MGRHFWSASELRNDEPVRKRRKQQTLDSLVGTQPLPQYFILKEDDERSFSAFWCDKIPEKNLCVWQTEATSGGRRITLVEISGRTVCHPYKYLDATVTCRNVPLLKSLLQKAVRRRNKRAATWAAFELAVVDVVSLLRRLPIILLEDVGLHDSFPAIVWMMVASSKGWKPNENQVAWMVDVVATYCEIESWNKLDSICEASLSDSDIVKRWKGYEPQCSLLLSMNTRLSYGGMACDQAM
eukprot:CAMPEP_0177582450 /NCGR_PEP_ID=MMETSP0419_2-20121207/2750_1 /TAXON_ID=582737 /ORGANISM="Tetraselmis sp., Strain GSL018" /LENGTH=239 /DNA_ID=CAMNT_0019071685 /DNA_START=224 /DNA_END=943 /DNA_ORIENTATION=+